MSNRKHQPRINRRGKRLFFTGFSMGIADLVPGVSGGTIAFLFGIYDELLFSIKAVTGNALRLLLAGKIKQAFAAVPFSFLVPVFLGILVAVFGLAEVFAFLLERQPVFVWSLFFGLVVGSAYIVSKRIAGWNTSRLLLLLAGLLITYSLVGLSSMNASSGAPFIFVTGAIASAAMVLPGISGSLIMTMLGQYQNIINAVTERNFLLLGVFALGAVFGLALFARLLSWLLHEHHSGTIAFLIGVMIGSLRRVWPWQAETDTGGFYNTMPDLQWVLLVSLGLMLAGFLVVWKLEKIGVAKEHIDIEDKEFKTELRSQHD